MNRLPIAVVDAHPLFLAGLCNLFATSDHLDVVATGTSAHDAIAIFRKHRPHLMVMDLQHGDDPFGAISEISHQAGPTKIIVLTASTCVDTALRALDAGANGYLLKNSPPEELTKAIEVVLRGETFLDSGFAVKAIVALRTAALRKTTSQPANLSIREQQVLQLLFRGLTNRAIAERLAISEKTVKHYMTRLMQKMHATNRLGVVIAAKRMEGAAAGHSDARYA